MKKIGFGITGSFCTHERILEEIKKLISKGYEILPIITPICLSTNTRYGTASSFVQQLEMITGNKVVGNIVDAEPIGPQNMIDALVIAPCTGNTLSKLANALSDNAVTMTAKALLRNNKPIIIGISSNDALGLNMANLSVLFNSKNFYFVPFGQDNPISKPKSLIADWDYIEETIISAFEGKQFQPVLK